MPQSTVLSNVRSTLKRYEMLPENYAVLCGFSGGADSVTLLSVLQELAKGPGDLPAFRLYACHVHHGIRGEEADRDEQFCRLFCKERDIPYFTRYADVPALAAERGESLETTGRAVRYETFAKMAEKILRQEPTLSGVKIATAHTASDNAETVLFHLARGTGLSGLTGIPPVRDDIIRPLIECTREEIEAYCAENGLDFMTDESNDDISYSRNRIRHEVLPALEQINPEAVRHIARTSATLRRDADCFEAEKQELLLRSRLSDDALSVPVLASGSDAVLLRLLQAVMWDFAGLCPEQPHLEAVLQWIRDGEKFKQLQIPGGAFVTLAGDRLLFHWPKSPEDPTDRTFRRTTTMEGLLEFHSDEPSPLTVRLTKTTPERAVFRGFLLENTLEYDKIDSNFILRTREPGDTFRPKGRGVTKKLKTLYQETGVPVEERGDKVILEQNGQIAWLEGYGAAEGFAPGQETSSIWTVEVLR